MMNTDDQVPDKVIQSFEERINNKKSKRADPPPVAAQPKVLHQIVISLHEGGYVQINGPFHDAILFKGLLEQAKDICRAHMDDMAKQQVAQAAQAITERKAAEEVKGSKHWWGKIARMWGVKNVALKRD